MELKSVAQAEAFIFFMESERLRHFKDIRQIDETVDKVCAFWGLKRPVLDPNKDYWVTVDEKAVKVTQPLMQERYHGPVDHIEKADPKQKRPRVDHVSGHEDDGYPD